MDNVKDIVQKVIGEISSQRDRQADDIIRAWTTCVGETAACHTHVVGIKEDTLLVYVDSSAWLYQMNLHKEKILKHLQQMFPQIKKIYLKIGKVQG